MIAGNWVLPHSSLAPWACDFLLEMSRFPGANHDDCVDAWSQAALQLKSTSRLDVFLKPVAIDDKALATRWIYKHDWGNSCLSVLHFVNTDEI